MRHTHGRVVDVESLHELDRRLAAGATSLDGWRVHGVDLSERGGTLLGLSLSGALFLGCEFAPGEEQAVRDAGGVVFHDLPASPVETFRTELYRPRELYDTERYADSLDARAYAWSQCPPDGDDAIARALHDHAVDQALAAWVAARRAAGSRVVGVMGGHGVARGQPAYADAARLGQKLGAAGLTVATGGGPGAMEAANAGALLSGSPEKALEEALQALAAVPSFAPDPGAWARVALEVVDGVTEPVTSLGVPTWHYGHEPPNVFATVIAKYFANATREAVLLEVCHAGVVFLPGAAGTVQEVFQDACENYYADPSSVAPMVLVGRRHWTQTLPAWPLLQALAREHDMADHVHLVDTVDEAAALLVA